MEKICKQCRKTFNADRAERKFCCKECYSKFQSEMGELERLQNNRGRKRKKRTTSTCEVCGKVFEHHIARQTKYCSRECWTKRNPPVLKECLLCDREFWSYKSDKKQYCSKKCYNIAQRDLQKGENSHFWDGGKTNKNQILRSRAEYTEWRLKVFIRDEYTCQDCGKKSGNGYKVYLQAHHLKSFSEYPDLRYEVDNGITLCKDCHRGRHTHKF